MHECLACGHALDAHLKGADTNPACACCRWEEPWEPLVITPVDYAANPFYAEDTHDGSTPRQEGQGDAA